MAETKRVVVAMGDSTTAGTPGWKSPLEAPPHGAGDETSQYAYWLMKARADWAVLNRGINGERSDQILARFDRDVIEPAPDAVVIIAGVNDVYQGRDAAHVIEQLSEMYSRASRAGIIVVAGTIIPYNTATPDQNARMRTINSWIQRSSQEDPALHFADTRAAVAAPQSPDLLDDTPDQLHPSPGGYRRIAHTLVSVLERALLMKAR